MGRLRQIKFTVIAKKWFDRVNGNTYHSVRCVRMRDNAIVVGQFQYGYGEHYKQTALSVMFDAGWFKRFTRLAISGIDPIQAKIQSENGFEEIYYTHSTIYLFEWENNYPILWTVSAGLKRDCVANGKL